jgi:ammonia channel protein AmtB
MPFYMAFLGFTQKTPAGGIVEKEKLLAVALAVAVALGLIIAKRKVWGWAVGGDERFVEVEV